MNVLFLIFNRPENTKKVFEKIRLAKPDKLYVAADGPRDHVRGENDLCRQTRDVIKVDWPCELKTLYQEENLGCKRAVSSAVSWFFSEVEEGIILEDDCVPDASLFPFFEKMLKLYENDEDVMVICGNHSMDPKFANSLSDDYFFSYYVNVWGWATWRRAWNKFDLSMVNWPKLRKDNFLSSLFSDNAVSYFKHDFDNAYLGKINTWDIQWFFTCLSNKGLVLTVNKNLVSNIGWSGTHTDRVEKKSEPITEATSVNIKSMAKKMPKIDNVMLGRQVDNIGANIFSWRLKIKNFLRSVLI